MDDLISRQAAIDAIVNTPSEVQNKNIPLVNQYDGATFRQIEILGIIEALPSAQPEQRWIPCSERLPEESIKQIMLGDEHTSDFVLVTIKGQTYPFPKTKVRVARYSYTYNAWQIANNNLGKVVAWMPLPEAWKGEHDG